MKEDGPRTGSSVGNWFYRLGQLLKRGEPGGLSDTVALLHDAQHRDLLDPDAMEMIEGVLQVAEMRVRDVMLPRSQMVVVNREDTPEELVRIALESGHSRFPVIEDSRDEVIGILLAKDLLAYAMPGNAEFSVRDVLRQAVFVPESKRLDTLLKEFRSSHNHLAVVVDEYGGVAGMVTIEDVLELIVGEIEDEHDIDEDQTIRPHSEDSFTVEALTEIDEFNEYFGADLSDEEYDTIGGLVMAALGHLPKRGETCTIGRFSFTVQRADRRRIHTLQMQLLPEVDETSQEAGG